MPVKFISPQAESLEFLHGERPKDALKLFCVGLGWPVSHKIQYGRWKVFERGCNGEKNELTASFLLNDLEDLYIANRRHRSREMPVRGHGYAVARTALPAMSVLEKVA